MTFDQQDGLDAVRTSLTESAAAQGFAPLDAESLAKAGARRQTRRRFFAAALVVVPLAVVVGVGVTVYSPTPAPIPATPAPATSPTPVPTHPATPPPPAGTAQPNIYGPQIGRASCRERV